MQNSLTRKLSTLFQIRNTLLEFENLSELISIALVLTRTKLNSQTASVFLFSKDGILERVNINGINKDKNPISPNWFPFEKHNTGNSFTGKVAQASGNSRYGEPRWTNKLQDEDVDPISKSKYIEELGSLDCAIAVPLNGQHRTYGVLEVINKLPKKGKKYDPYPMFSPDDVYWVSIIGSNLATAISALRRKNELRTLANISQWLVEPFGHGAEVNKIYHEIAKRLVGPIFNYKACIIRVDGPKGVLSISGREGDDIKWNDLTDESLEKGIGIAWKVYNDGKYKIIEDISEHQTEFKNATWIQSNKLKSYICLPLSIKNKIVGTLSLFTGFHYHFYESDIKFLENIAFLIATFAQNSKITNELKATQSELDRERNKILSSARAIGYEHSIHGLLHDHKHDLLSILKDLETAEESSPNRRLQIIRRQIFDIQKKVDRLMKEMERQTTISAADINKVIRDVIRIFRLEIQSAGEQIIITEEYSKLIPLIYVKETELRDVIFNLLSNAIKAIRAARHKTGQIKVTTEIITLDIPYIQITVEDNGIGIRSEFQEKIYSKGYTTYEDGSGVGLFITRSIVGGYGGKIDFESSVGKGTKFYVRLPKKRLEV